MRVERSDRVAWRSVDGETIVIHLGRRRLFGLDHLGGLVWQALETAKSLEELGTLVSGAHHERGDHAPSTIDIFAFVSDLLAEDLILCTEATPVSTVAPSSRGPKIEWREEIQQFAGQCHLVYGQSHQCNQHPGGS